MPRASTRLGLLPTPALLTYALAAAGGVIGYMPMLTLLLPIKLEILAEADRYGALAACGVAGALAAGAANIVFGWLGDRSVARGRGRRGWLVWGTIATILSFAGIVLARDAVAIIAAIVLFQVAINAVLAQVAALIAEEVPAEQKGTTAALLTLGNPLAAGTSAIAVAIATSEAARLAIVAALMTICLLPLAFVRTRSTVVPEPSDTAGIARRRLTVVWTARLLMQIAANGVGIYLLFFFEELLGNRQQMPATVARLILYATIVPVPLAVLLGRWSDRVRRRTPFLAGTAALATAGLVGMAIARSWPVAAVSYVAVASGLAIFAALNTGHAMLLLPDAARRGRDLGILNLANTVPQIVAPLLAWWSAMTYGLGGVLAVLAVFTLLAGLLPLLVDDGPRSDSQPERE